jgi:hypothetical protein
MDQPQVMAYERIDDDSYIYQIWSPDHDNQIFFKLSSWDLVEADDVEITIRQRFDRAMKAYRLIQHEVC